MVNTVHSYLLFSVHFSLAVTPVFVNLERPRKCRSLLYSYFLQWVNFIPKHRLIRNEGIVGSNPIVSTIKGLRCGYNRSGVYFCSEMPDGKGFCSIIENNETVQKCCLESGILSFSACLNFSYTSGTKHFCFEWFV